MKIGLLTYHFSENYGALFQAYALREWFLSQGHDAEFINYHPEHVEGGGDINLKKLFSKRNLKVIYLKLSTLKNKLFGNSEQHNKFELFRSEYLAVAKPTYKTIEDIEKAHLNYDLLVCGSDQIWNPSEQFGLDPVYFLNFKIDNAKVRRISYAPSFGRSEIQTQYHKTLINFLDKLDGVSIREESGVSIINNLTGINPVCVPDPTILITDYSSIMTPYTTQKKNYVFCYTLRSSNVIAEVAQKISAKFGSALYSPYNTHRRWKEIGETVYPCPRQWLYLLNNSEFVVTNSFHGAALSIILNKPFVIVGLQGNKLTLNARVLNLLELVGLSSRFLMSATPEKVDEIVYEKIDWEQVNMKLSLLRNNGSKYLTEQIELAS